MVKARLMAVALLVAGVFSVAPASQNLPSAKSGPECDSAEDCASPRLAVAEERPNLLPLAAAEADPRANDRDWCNVVDTWSTDVRELYTLTGATILDAAPTTDPAIKLIELSIESADADEDEKD